MNSVTLTKGSTSVTIYTSKLDYDVSKSWKINPIPNPASSWTETTLSSGASVGASSIVVASSSGFREEDSILIGES